MPQVERCCGVSSGLPNLLIDYRYLEEVFGWFDSICCECMFSTGPRLFIGHRRCDMVVYIGRCWWWWFLGIPGLVEIPPVGRGSAESVEGWWLLLIWWFCRCLMFQNMIGSVCPHSAEIIFRTLTTLRVSFCMWTLGVWTVWVRACWAVICHCSWKISSVFSPLLAAILDMWTTSVVGSDSRRWCYGQILFLQFRFSCWSCSSSSKLNIELNWLMLTVCLSAVMGCVVLCMVSMVGALSVHILLRMALFSRSFTH